MISRGNVNSERKGREAGFTGVGPGPAGRPRPAEAAVVTGNGAQTEQIAAEQPRGAGLVCVASGPGWSLFWPRAEWEGLKPAARRRVIRNARRRYAVEPVEDDQLDPFDELVEQGPPAWREWGD